MIASESGELTTAAEMPHTDYRALLYCSKGAGVHSNQLTIAAAQLSRVRGNAAIVATNHRDCRSIPGLQK